MKRLWCVILVVAMTLCCGAAVAEGSKPFEGITITVNHGQGEWMLPIFDEIAAGFEEETGAKVEYVVVTSEDHTTWLTAQFAAGLEPDVFYNAAFAFDDYFNQGKILDLTPYYDGPSMVNGNIPRWRDAFQDHMLDNCYDASGEHLISSTVSRAEWKLYYNIDLMEELGLGSVPPSSLSELIEMMEVVRQDGRYIPMCVMNSINIIAGGFMGWNMQCLADPFIECLYSDTDVVERLNIVNAGNDYLDAPEILLGLKSGVLAYDDERMVEFYQILKDLTPYFNADYNACSWEYESLFNEGKAVFYLNGGWFPSQVILNDLDLNYGVTLLPYIDDSISAHSTYNAEHPYIAAGTAGEQAWGVSQKAQDEGRGEAAVAFLQYLTDGSSGAQVWLDGTLLLPVSRDVEYPAITKSMEATLEDGQEFHTSAKLSTMFSFSPEAQNTFWTIWHEYMDPASEISAEEFAAQVADAMLPLVDEALEDHPEYDLDSYMDQVAG